ncbi:MAG: hypothetical protein IJT16_03420 [Lachnospiraceae bacterium]|nr:hypothetical protein [Lachnospiraceae bacterium]
MIEQSQLLSINYYKKGKPFTGSDTGMRYRIAKVASQDSSEESCFQISVWAEPYCYEETPKNEIIEKQIPYTPENFLTIADYLNEMHERLFPEES